MDNKLALTEKRRHYELQLKLRWREVAGIEL